MDSGKAKRRISWAKRLQGTVQTPQGARTEKRRRREARVMKLALLIVIALMGVAIPLLWITGTLASAVYFLRQKIGTAHEEPAVVLDPQLGLTMADGGDAIDKEKKT
jgi:hypothetical protein